MKVLISLIATLVATLALSAGQDASGSWTKKSQKMAGSWQIADGKVVLRGFSTKSAPDLKIFLSPKPVGDLGNSNATSGAVLVAKLKSAKGDQTYTLPAGVDLSKFKSILVHCEKYSKLWGAAAL